MTRDEIETALDAMTGAWRGSRTMPSLDTWRSVLAQCDTEPAVRAIARLIDSCKHAPTIAEFREVYANEETATAPPVRKASPRCELCGGTGWQEGPPERYTPSLRMLAMLAEEEKRAKAKRELWVQPTFERSTVVPCPCSAAAEATHRRIVKGDRR